MSEYEKGKSVTVEIDLRLGGFICGHFRLCIARFVL